MTIANILSLLSNDYLLMLVAVVFYMASRKTEYGHLVILLLFAMVYKAFLKELLKIPAPETSPTKYGFPSGHINFATMFFGWFMITYRTKLIYCIGSLCLITGSISTVYLGYHNVVDVIVTPILPISMLCLYYKYMKDIVYEKFIYIFVAISTILQIISYLSFDKIPIDVYIGSYGILGFGILKFTTNKSLAMVMLTTLILNYAISDGHFFRKSIWFIVFSLIAIAHTIKNRKIG